MGERRRGYRVLVGKPEGNPGVDGRIMLTLYLLTWRIW
jgi:hypothetical protein